jgi:flagellar motor protein MotB
MRGGVRPRPREEEEESVFVSMTDMTVSFLFIVMLLLAYFASRYSDSDMVPRSTYNVVVEERDKATQEIERLLELIREREIQIKLLQRQVSQRDDTIEELKEELRKKEREIADLRKRLEKVRDPLETYLATSSLERKRILETLRDQLKVDFPDLKVVISEQNDALRFQGDGLFATGSAILRSDRQAIVESIAARLADILPCYTVGPRSEWRENCNPGIAVIEALQIEGHTDSTGNSDANLTLSTNRANSTFFTMARRSPQLIDYLNTRQQPVLSVAGYGQMRPVSDNTTREGRDTNRRVDLRIIMYTPRGSAEIDKIRQALENKGPLERKN